MARISVGVLGLGMVGQRFIQLLADHPLFQVVAVGASEQSVGWPCGKILQGRWKFPTPIPDDVAGLIVQPCSPEFFPDCAIIFSALDAKVAGAIEEKFAAAGHVVSSNAKNHRMASDVPILIAEVNADHLGLIEVQRRNRGWRGCIVTNGNCSTIILALVLKVLQQFGLSKVHVVTLQALSGAGENGVAALDATDNLIPYIAGEQEKLETETPKILGTFKDGIIVPAPIIVSAQCNRVPVIDGHTECVSVALDAEPSITEVVAALSEWNPIGNLQLPSSPLSPIIVTDEINRPQPRLDRERGNGMAVVVGGISRCPVLGYRFVCLGNNTIRGAAGGAVSDAELLVEKGFVKP